MNEIYMDVGISECRTAVIDNGNLAEIHIESQNREALAGNIYKGRVENVLPGMQAAFVDIGHGKNAFLYVKDALGYETEDVSINKVLRPGDEILVQVSKEPSGSKGARVTTHITIPGRYVVFMPDIDYIGISRRIEVEAERNRLRSLAARVKPEKSGLIVRTEAEGKDEQDLIEDINFLEGLWSKIDSDASRVKAPNLVYKELDLVYRSIRDLFNRGTKKLVINDRETYTKAMELVEIFSPDQKEVIEYYDGSVNVFEFYGIEDKIEKALSKRVWLKSGGYIIIDQTEALTSIDVNTGKFTGSSSLKDTVLLTNIEASREIARQLRLRDIGGIIIIDFIDMEEEEHQNMVIDTLKSELKKDRTKSVVFGMTELGLVEMTRKKVGRRLSSVMQKQCPLCEGNGSILDEEFIVRKVERELVRIFKETDVPAVLVEVNDAIEYYIRQSESDDIKYLEDKYNKKILLKGLGSIGYSEIKVKLLGDKTKIDETLRTFENGDRVEVSALKSKYLNASDRYVSLSGTVKDVIYGDDGAPLSVTIDMSRK